MNAFKDFHKVENLHFDILKLKQDLNEVLKIKNYDSANGIPNFAAICLNQIPGNINSTKGVSHVVKFGLNFANVPFSVIEFIKTNQHITSEKLKNLNKFKPGDKVQISDGALKNWVAIFESYRSDERVTLLMNLLGREQSLSIKKKSVIAL